MLYGVLTTDDMLNQNKYISASTLLQQTNAIYQDLEEHDGFQFKLFVEDFNA